jgi:hypothetical protein
MQTRYLARSLTAAALILCPSIAESGVLAPIPSVPGSTATYAYDINNSNMIAGEYTTADGVRHGFFGTLDGNYTRFDVPDTGGGAIALDDNGDIVGVSVSSETCPYYGCGFRRISDGALKFFSMKHGPIDGGPGDVSGNAFVGDYRFLDENGYLNVVPYIGKGTKYAAEISLPFNTIHASARGFHGSHFVEGWFRDRDDGYRDRGFVVKDGVATAYDYPDDQAEIVQFERMNSKGRIAGAWYDGQQNFANAFLFDWRKQKFLPIALSGTYVYATSVNDAGLATVGADGNPYLYCPSKKTCPIQSAADVEVPEKWIPARNVESRICRNGCLEPHRVPHRVKIGDASRAVTARDPELQRELRLPFRP